MKCPVCAMPLVADATQCKRCGWDAKVIVYPQRSIPRQSPLSVPIEPSYQELSPLPMNNRHRRDLLFFIGVGVGLFLSCSVWSIIVVATHNDNGTAIVMFMMVTLYMVFTFVMNRNPIHDVQSNVVQQAVVYLERWHSNILSRDMFKYAEFSVVGTLAIVRSFRDSQCPVNRWYRITYSPHSKRLWTIEPYQLEKD